MISGQINVMLFTGARVRYGAEEHMLTLLRNLPRTHFRLHMACPPELAAQIGSDLPSDVELVTLPLLGTKARDILPFCRILKQRRIAILHSHMSFSSRFASPIGWACRVPIILETPHVAENWRRSWLKSYFPDRVWGRFVRYFIAVSEANSRYLIHTKGLPSKKVVTVRNGCDTKRFQPSAEKRAMMRQKLGLLPDTPVLVVPARLEPQKGHSVLLDAIPRIVREFPNLQVFCLGEGSLRKDLEARTAQLDLLRTVHFPGFQPDMVAWFTAADLTVLSSFYEGLPLILIESLAASRPAVATAVDGTPEVIVDGVTGKTVPPGDPAALADAICSLLRQPALIETFGSNGRRLVEQEFSEEANIKKTTDLYLRAVRERQRFASDGNASA